jgi:hypothetical protein
MVNILRFLKDLEQGTFILVYSSPYRYYKNRDQFNTNLQTLAGYYLNALVSSITYFLRGGGSSKILFSAFVQLFYAIHEDYFFALDKHNDILCLQFSILLCIMEINQHADRQRLSISILN